MSNFPAKHLSSSAKQERRNRSLTMRTVTVKVETKLTMKVDEGVDRERSWVATGRWWHHRFGRWLSPSALACSGYPGGPGRFSIPCRKKHQKSKVFGWRTNFFLLFWHTWTVALDSRTRFSAISHIIATQLAQVWSDWFCQGSDGTGISIGEGLFENAKIKM